jgi:CheY-like chemotaxis protein
VVIRAKLDAEDQRSAEVRFSVEDQGIGIPADRQAEVFSPFTQVDGATARKYGGTGLGLAISRQLAELMGGKIGLESELGKGSIFWFAVPFQKPFQESPRAAEAVATNPVSRQPRRSSRILIAEDNLTNQQVALALLDKLGYEADVVADGKEALRALASSPYDLVLMDCQMPEMNGYEAAARIRDPQSGVRNSKIPIVALTAHAMQGDREKCLEAGMDDYITKPVNPRTLAAMLEKWLPPESQKPL